MKSRRKVLAAILQFRSSLSNVLSSALRLLLGSLHHWSRHAATRSSVATVLPKYAQARALAMPRHTQWHERNLTIEVAAAGLNVAETSQHKCRNPKGTQTLRPRGPGSGAPNRAAGLPGDTSNPLRSLLADSELCAAHRGARFRRRLRIPQFGPTTSTCCLVLSTLQ